MTFPDITDGILLIDKPAGMTSFGVVARVRRRLTESLRLKAESQKLKETQAKRSADADAVQGRAEQRSGVYKEVHVASSGSPDAAMRHVRRPKVKVGHTGTLDPFATGLMILVIGKECKNAGAYSKLDKVYEATIRLGETSTTGDPEGAISKVEEPALGSIEGREYKVEEIEKVLQKFTGEIEQTPPIFSAIKVNGQRAYKLARKGEEVEIPVRKVTIHALEMVDYSYPELKIRTHVSSGTYIRSLAVDIGAALGTGAYCSQLRRLKVAQYDVEEAYRIADDGSLTK